MSSEYFSSEQVVSGSTKTLETLWNINELIGRIINFCDTILNRQLSLVYPSHPSHYKELRLNENSKKEYQLKQLFVLRCFRCIRHTQQIIGFSVRSQKSKDLKYYGDSGYNGDRTYSPSDLLQGVYKRSKYNGDDGYSGDRLTVHQICFREYIITTTTTITTDYYYYYF